MDRTMSFEAPFNLDFGSSPRFAARAAPAAICCFFDFAFGIVRSPDLLNEVQRPLHGPSCSRSVRHETCSLGKAESPHSGLPLSLSSFILPIRIVSVG